MVAVPFGLPKMPKTAGLSSSCTATSACSVMLPTVPVKLFILSNVVALSKTVVLQSTGAGAVVAVVAERRNTHTNT